MHPAIGYELATARIADLRRQAQRGFGQQLWTLLRAQVLLDRPAGIREAVEECVRQLGQAGREEAIGEEGASPS
jgi:hypothetical protein